MHRAAAAAADPGGAAIDLRHQQLRIAVLGDEMAMAAMRAGDPVAGRQMGADADRDRLLPDIEMHRAGQVAGERRGAERFLHLADEDHLAEQRELLVGR